MPDTQAEVDAKLLEFVFDIPEFQAYLDKWHITREMIVDLKFMVASWLEDSAIEAHLACIEKMLQANPRLLEIYTFSLDLQKAMVTSVPGDWSFFFPSISNLMKWQAEQTKT